MDWVDEFSFDEWLSRYSLDSREATEPSFLGPDHICLAELLRREVSVEMDLSSETRYESDVFVLGYGEGPNRHGTKIGGLPYFQKRDPWPRSKSTGRPLSFVCQFRFDESVDLVGEVPGDVLLVFSDMVGFYRDRNEWHFQWRQLGADEKDLVTEQDVPGTGMPQSPAIPTCYGVRVRYADYENAHVIATMWQTLRKRPRFRRKFNEMANVSIIEALEFIRVWACQLCVFKIGGIPYWAKPIEALLQQRNTGRFLALIPPIAPLPVFGRKDKVQWINGVNLHDESSLIWPPEGCIHLYLTSENVVEARFASLEP